MNEKDKLNLIQYIKTEQSKGLPTTQIEETLLSEGGWTHDDLIQVFSSLDVASQPSANASPTTDKTKLVTGWNKAWYTLLIPSLWICVVAVGLFKNIWYSSPLSLNEGKIVIGFLIVMELVLLGIYSFIVRGIARSAARGKPWKVLLKILLFLFILFSLWAVNKTFTSCFDCDTERETYAPSSLPAIETTTDHDFTLLQGQSANITDIDKRVKYKGYSSGAWGTGVEFDFVNSSASYENPKAKDYHVVMVSNNIADHMTATFRVETKEKTCESQEFGVPTDICWQSLGVEKSKPEYCLNIGWHNNRRDCFSGIAKKIYFANENHEEAVLQARESCKLEDTNEFNMCTAIGKEKPLTQKECIGLIGDQNTMTFNKGFYNECFYVAVDIYPDKWNPALCGSIQEEDIRRWCEMLPKEQI